MNFFSSIALYSYTLPFSWIWFHFSYNFTGKPTGLTTSNITLLFDFLSYALWTLLDKTPIKQLFLPSVLQPIDFSMFLPFSWFSTVHGLAGFHLSANCPHCQWALPSAEPWTGFGRAYWRGASPTDESSCQAEWKDNCVHLSDLHNPGRREPTPGLPFTRTTWLWKGRSGQSTPLKHILLNYEGRESFSFEMISSSCFFPLYR